MSPELVMEISIEIFPLQALKANAFIRASAHVHQRRQRHYKGRLRFHCTAHLPHHHLQRYKTCLQHTDMVNDIFSFIVLTPFMVCNLVTTPSLGIVFCFSYRASRLLLVFFPCLHVFFLWKNLKCCYSLASNPQPSALPISFISLHSCSFNNRP